MTAPIVTSYQNWLRSRSYSEATIRNYLVDLNKYFLFSSVETHCVRLSRTQSGFPQTQNINNNQRDAYNASLPENNSTDLQITDKIFNEDNLSSYFQNINQDQNYKRFLASLSKFFQFALDQHLISTNPFPKALKSTGEPTLPPVEDIVKLYQQQLEAKKSSLSTIRNYINDIHQFINWNKSYPNPPLTKEGANNFLSPFVKGRNVRPLANERDFELK